MVLVTLDHPFVRWYGEVIMVTEKTEKKKRGFAVMDREVVAEISRKGGIAAHEAGTAHEFTIEEARRAGRLGGRASHAKKQAAQAAKEADLAPAEAPRGTD